MTRKLHAVPAADIPATELRWLWRGLFPLGKMTVVAGLPGLGKSMLTANLAAGASTGTLPGDCLHSASGVLLASAEDDPSDTTVPRLIAAGADLSRVALLDMRDVDQETGETAPGIIELPGDWAEIRRVARERRARLVVLDPIAAFLDGDHSAYNNQQVRSALAGGKALAQDLGCAVVTIMHLNKGDSRDPLARIADSGAFTALARSVLLLGRDPDDPDGESGKRRVLTVVKSNLADDTGEGLLLEVGARSITAAGRVFDAPVIDVIGGSTASAADLLGGGDSAAIAEARAFLREELADGPRPSREIQTAARDAGIAERTLRRARDLDCESVKEKGKGGRWLVQMKDAMPQGEDILAPIGRLREEDLTGSKTSKEVQEGPTPQPLGQVALSTDEEQDAYERALRLVDGGAS